MYIYKSFEFNTCALSRTEITGLLLLYYRKSSIVILHDKFSKIIFRRELCWEKIVHANEQKKKIYSYTFIYTN